jgi:ATP-dependent Clp protease ATP-binding subunit ClpA
MFERFSKEARAAVIKAQEVARDEHSGVIDSRHVLVALIETPGPAVAAVAGSGLDTTDAVRTLRRDIRAGDALDADALAALGIDLDAVRDRTDAVFGEGALDRAGAARRRRSPGHIPFTPDAKKGLELALREAIRLKSSTIDGGHLLLGILRDTRNPAARALSDAGADLGRIRHLVENRTDAA